MTKQPIERLSKRQVSILVYLATYLERYGFAPQLAEIADKHRISASATQREMSALQQRGYIVRMPKRRYRNVRLTPLEASS